MAIELNEVWSHFDTGECSGQAVGVRGMLDNGVSAYIPLKMLSNSRVEHPEERVQVSVWCDLVVLLCCGCCCGVWLLYFVLLWLLLWLLLFLCYGVLFVVMAAFFPLFSCFK